MHGSGCVHGKEGMRGKGSMCGKWGHSWQGSGGMHGRGACIAGGMHDRGICVAGETATSADGTHPIGMHSCVRWVLGELTVREATFDRFYQFLIN